MEVPTIQRDIEISTELFQLKEVFEENLRTYEGTDPLEHWYDYVLKVENCYLKIGNTSSLAPLLEKCLQTFETDNRYINDRRLCQLWIKYIDLQSQNPLELYQLLYSKKICIQCADLYCAWALYHELAGNFQQADNVFEMGMWAFAQPYEELVIAHKNMIFMAGLQAIRGVDERRNIERRQILTSLHRNKLNQSSFYSTSQSNAENHHPSLPFLSNNATRQEPVPASVSVSVPEQQVENISSASSSAAVVGIIGTKQNVSAHPEGIRLFPNHCPVNHDDFSDWKVEMIFPEPPSSDLLPMYPKHLVYTDGTEYSPEEIRARRYHAKKKQMSVTSHEHLTQEVQNTDHHMATETEQAVQSIVGNEKDNHQSPQRSINYPQEHEMQHASPQKQHYLQQQREEVSQNYSRQSYYPNVTSNQSYDASKFIGFSPQPNHIMNEKGDAQASVSQNFQNYSQHSNSPHTSIQHDKNDHSSAIQNPPWQNPAQEEMSFMKEVNDIWKDSTAHESRVEVAKPNIQSFLIHEDTRLFKDETMKHDVVAQKTNIKTPFTDRSSEEMTKKKVDSNRKAFVIRDNENYIPNENSSAQSFAPPDRQRQFLSQPTHSPKTFVARDNENYIPNENSSAQPFSTPDHKRQFLSQPSHSPKTFVARDSENYIPTQDSTAHLFSTPDRQRQFLSQPTHSPHSRQELFAQPRNAFVVPDRNLANQSKPKQFLSQTGPETERHNEFAHPAKKVDMLGIFEDNGVNLNDSCNTQVFNYNLKQASTPCNPKKMVVQQYALEQNGVKMGKQKFLSELTENPTEEEHPDDKWYQNQNQQKNLSVIYETTKELCSSSGSSSGGTTLKTTTFNAYSLKAIPENVNMEEHSHLSNNTHSKIYMQTNTQQAHYQMENKNYEVAHQNYSQNKSQHTSYSQNVQQPNKNYENNHNYSQNANQNFETSQHLNYSQNANFQQNNTFESSQRFNQSKNFEHWGADVQNFPSNVQACSPATNRHVRPEENYRHMQDESRTRKSQQVAYATSLLHDQSNQVPVKQSQVHSDQSCIYIADDTMREELNQSKDLMHFSDNDPNRFQSHQFKKKFPEQRLKETQESPSKNQDVFFEGSNDSNSNSLKDIWGRSPAKGSRMDVDVLSQNSNSEFKMDYDSCPEPTAKEDLSLLKTPSDPLSQKSIKFLLRKAGFPQPRHRQNFVQVQSLPRLVKKEVICISDERYLIGAMIGKGTFGSVFKATRISNNDIVALKFQKPANQWEFYICNEIQLRLKNPYLLNAFMSVQVGYFSASSSILVSEFCKYGSLLDISNKVKQVTGKGIKELVVIYFANEIVTIVNELHKCQIIHADIKPDNFLVTRMPPEFGHPCLQLIDFGCSIDMTLFPKDTTFTKVINTENFTCPEMKDGRPWTYQTDLFCAAATVHVLLFEKYMQMHKKDSVWTINNRVPRYLRADLWNTFFYQFLNIESCDKLPDLLTVKKSFETILSEQSDELQVDMRFVANSVNGR